MSNSRLEAFCDGVFAIALTLLIIDIKVPHTVPIESTADLWRALFHILPSILAFLLGFIIILIAWVNHHATLHLVKKATPAFIYANGFLLLTVVFMPFPTSLLGEHILTDHAAPAVILYNVVMAVQAISWIVLFRTAIGGRLVKDEKSVAIFRENKKNGFFGFAIYSALAILAVWFPLAVAIITTLTWISWLFVGIRMKHE